MRASTDQVRSATIDAVEAARHRAAGVVGSSADIVTSAVEKGASVVEGGIEKVADRVPTGSVAVSRRPRRHRVRTLLIGAVVLAVILAVAKKLTAQAEPERPDLDDANVGGAKPEPTDAETQAEDADDSAAKAG
jgi:hypothetical protein